MAGYRTPGPMCQVEKFVIIDKGTLCLLSTPTPGPIGKSNVWTAGLKHPRAIIAANNLAKFGEGDETEFMHKVYDAQLQHSLKKRQYFAGLPEEKLEVIEGRYKMRKDAAQACCRLLVQARADLERQQSERNEHALKVTKIGIASAYRDPQDDKKAWERAFLKHYLKTQHIRSGLVGGEHGDEAVEFLAEKLRGIKAVPGFSNHTSGIAVDFLTIENKRELGANSDQKSHWKEAWFYKWLTSNANRNANRYGFAQLITEEWHWDYKV